MPYRCIWQILELIATIKPEIPNLVFILYLVCKLWTDHVTDQRWHLWFNYLAMPMHLTNFKGNTSDAARDKTSVLSFFLVCKLYPCHEIEVMTSPIVIFSVLVSYCVWNWRYRGGGNLSRPPKKTASGIMRTKLHEGLNIPPSIQQRKSYLWREE